jgi:hypothetical protein
LQDSFGSVVDLRNNHWSFSMVFQVHWSSMVKQICSKLKKHFLKFDISKTYKLDDET